MRRSGIAEGTAATVVVPREALLVFPQRSRCIDLSAGHDATFAQEETCAFACIGSLAAALRRVSLAPARRRRSTSSPPATRTWSTTSTTISGPSSRR